MSASRSGDSADDKSNKGNLSVLLHPLVIFNISEHWMRQKLAEDSADVVVYGTLMGKNRGLEVEVSCRYPLISLTDFQFL